MSSYLCFLPPLLTLIIAIFSKNIFVSLFIGTIISSIIANGIGFIPPILETYMVEGITGNVSIFIMLGIFGILMTTIQKTGGFAAFSRFAQKHIRSPKAAKVVTWFLSLIIPEASTATVGVGSIMRSINDQQKVPREKVGVILSSTGTMIGALVPWSVYLMAFSGMISAFAPDLNGTTEYMASVKFQFFAMASILMALLIALEILPDIGYMKKCEKRTRETGLLFNPESNVAIANFSSEAPKTADGKEISDIFTFIIPFAIAIPLLIQSYFRNGMIIVTTPFMVGLVALMIYALIRKYIRVRDIPGLIVEGFINYAPIIVLLALAFTFSKSVSALGLAGVAVEMLSGLPVQVMPVLIYVFCALVSYAAGSLLTASSMLLPIALALGTIPGANMSLLIAACIGGSAFGDTTSMLSDMVVQSSTGAGCDVVELGKAQFGIKSIMAAVVGVVYLIVGFIV